MGWIQSCKRKDTFIHSFNMTIKVQNQTFIHAKRHKITLLHWLTLTIPEVTPNCQVQVGRRHWGLKLRGGKRTTISLWIQAMIQVSLKNSSYGMSLQFICSTKKLQWKWNDKGRLDETFLQSYLEVFIASRWTKNTVYFKKLIWYVSDSKDPFHSYYRQVEALV